MKRFEVNSNYEWAYNNRGVAYDDLQKYNQAISDYTQAIKLNSNYAELYAMRGECYRLLDNNSEAEKDFAKARELGWKG